MPEFSVVISVYNKEAHIAKTLQSVLAQTIQDFEIVILNDGSTDTSEAAIRPFLTDSRIRYYSEENKGAGAGRNYVIKKAKGNYIALLDADDIWYPFYLEEQQRAIKKFPKESVFATASEIQKKTRRFPRTYSITPIEDKILKVDYFNASFLDSILQSSTTVVKKQVFETVGYYDPTIKSGQDTDLYVRIGLQYNIIFNPKVCVLYIVHADSLFRSVTKVSERPDFKAYEIQEKTNSALKKFLDLNRYSLCLLARLEGNSKAFYEFYKKIDLENLTKRQRFLLRQRRPVLKALLKTKERLSYYGLRLSAYK
ncbi:glycosyltransferase family 2 protein [Cochleicola gelatinilyticus]|uniref:Glycosyltransferase 2-like domain-containing protein n=1 Tax=Cochleicola gelatinilyticus TaxID=1763537 RepID=A0A167KEC7_9FLAO|nr:glycosyltransferase family 2 protein [Cochleicola gelatinilyticus]OAB81802.1 hypothetical protein ULVI_00235 [Cochleicola gelatinilyticus]